MTRRSPEVLEPGASLPRLSSRFLAPSVAGIVAGTPTVAEQIARQELRQKIRIETEPTYALRHTLLELGRVAANFSVTTESLEEMQRLLDEAKKKFDEVNNG